MNKRHHLHLKPVGIDTYRENVVYMHRECRLYRTEGFQALSKIEIRCGSSTVQGVLNVVDDSSILEPGDLGLSEQAFARRGAKVRNMREAMYLRRLFEFVGAHMNLHLEVVITDGRQPVGRGIGPVLEARQPIPGSGSRGSEVMQICGFEDDRRQGSRLAKALGLSYTEIDIHRFPDGESLVRLPELVSNHLVLVRTLDHPSNRISLTPILAAALRGG